MKQAATVDTSPEHHRGSDSDLVRNRTGTETVWRGKLLNLILQYQLTEAASETEGPDEDDAGNLTAKLPTMIRMKVQGYIELGFKRELELKKAYALE